jgi:hypothetical protein
MFKEEIVNYGISRTIKTNYIKWVKRQEEDNEIEIKSEIIILILL